MLRQRFTPGRRPSQRATGPVGAQGVRNWVKRGGALSGGGMVREDWHEPNVPPARKMSTAGRNVGSAEGAESPQLGQRE